MGPGTRLASATNSPAASWNSPTELRVRASVQGGFHLNANHAAQGMIPTTLSLAVPRDVDVTAEIDYPPGDERRFPFATEAIRVYDGEVTIIVRLDRPLPAGTVLRAALTYQPCTEEACLPAVSKTLDVTAPA